MKTHKKIDAMCPIAFTLDIIGDRWAILIVRDILFRNKSSFGDFLQSEKGIATNILTSRLKQLEERSIISKNKDQKNLTKYIYRLTEKGLDLLPIMIEMILYAGKHDLTTGIPQALLKEIKNDKDKYIEDSRKKYQVKNK